MKSQNQSAQNQGNINQELPKLGAVCASSALHVLYKKAKPHLSDHELNHLANLDDVVISEVINLQEHLQALGGFFVSTAKVDSPSDDSIGFMFYGLAHQLDTIAGLINVSSDAAYQLEKRKTGNGGSDE